MTIRNWKWCLIFLVVFILALAFRLPCLDHRPIHGDEAVHAYKFGELLEKGIYRYDPQEYHGATLNVFTLIPAWLSGKQTYRDLNEIVLRTVPVFFGCLLLLLHGWLAKALGKPIVLWSLIFLAVSPAFVFYQRYYIQESLLVCFTFGAIVCGFRYLYRPHVAWAIGTGLFLGLMHATKETAILAWFAMFLSLLIIWLTGKSKQTGAFKSLKMNHVLIGLGVAVFTSVIFFSSFFTYPQGIWDSIATYKIYFQRGAASPLHSHPWYTYFQWLLYTHQVKGPVWTEALIFVLALVGLFTAFTRLAGEDKVSVFKIFVAWYALIITAVYSMVPYKTPWCLLSFWHGWILLAAFGVVELFQLASSRYLRWSIAVLLICGTGHLIYLSVQTNFTYDAEPQNPHVYAHPLPEILQIIEQVDRLSRIHPQGEAMRIDVICPDNDYWPLPWYLRHYQQIAWGEAIDKTQPPAPLILTMPDMLPSMANHISGYYPPGQKELYVEFFDQPIFMRPQIEICGFIQSQWWQKLQEKPLE